MKPNPGTIEPVPVRPQDFEINALVEILSERDLAIHERRPLDTAFLRKSALLFLRYLDAREEGCSVKYWEIKAENPGLV